MGNDQYQSPWVDEGLAEYSVACYYRARGFVNVAREMVSNAEDAYAIRLAIKGSEGVRFDKPLPDLAEGYYDRVYCGGFLLFCTLSELFGENAFCLALKTFAEKYQGDTPAPSDLILSLSTSLGKDLTSLFRAWLTGTVPLQ